MSDIFHRTRRQMSDGRFAPKTGHSVAAQYIVRLGPIASLRTAENQGALSARDHADIHDSLKFIRRTTD